MSHNLEHVLFVCGGDRDDFRSYAPSNGVLKYGIHRYSIIDKPLLIGSGMFAVVDTNDHPALIGECSNYDAIFLSQNIEDLTLSNRFDNAIVLGGDYALLANPWSGSFYHWFEELFRVLILELIGFKGTYIVHSGGSFIPQSLSELGIESSRLYFNNGSDLIVEKLWVTPRTNLQFPAFDMKNLIMRLRDLLIKDAPNTNRRILCLRGVGANNKRDIVNLEEVVAISEKFGYEAVDIGRLSFRDQINTASSASSMIGAHGAAFCHTAFMPESSSVVEFFSPMYINYTFLTLMEALSHDYVPVPSIMWGEYGHGKNPHVFPDLLKLILGRI